MQDSSKPGALTRREALKVLAATTGALVLSNLPQAWKTPIVEIGVLPAHAQGASGSAPTISNLQGSGDGCFFNISFNYFDPRGQVSNASTIGGTLLNQSFGGPISNGGFLNGSGFNGSIGFNFEIGACNCFTGNTSGLVRLTVNGRQSNLANGPIAVACLG